MSRRNLTLLLLIIWVAVFAWSFVFTLITPPTGDSFTRGLNRMSGFIGWQALGFVLAIIIWRVGAGFPKTTILCRVSHGPIVAHLLVVLGIVAIIVWTLLFQPPIDPTPTITPTIVTQ